MKYRMFSHISHISLGLFIGLSASFAVAGTTAKKNVCSITINSNDEIELFKKGLSEKEFTFTELTLIKSNKEGGSSNDEENNWLKESCKQGITCDMLVISGHFGGSFFGASGLSLPLETLEKASCDNTCSGVLHNPKEVFLFGCNTLAGKEQDRRTPEQYAQVLMQDGFSQTQAQQIAAFRYSALGSSFSDRMSRIFSKVPRIYGFSSIAPSGKNAAPYLRNYLKGAAPTYFDYLANVSKEVNSSLKENFKVTALTQTTGNSNTNTPVCYIENDNLSNEAKLNYILEVVDKGGILELAPFLVSYFEQLDTKSLTANEKQILEKIYANENGKGRLNSFLEKPIDGLLKPQVDILNLMVKLNWVSNQGYDQQITSLVLSPFYEKPTVTNEVADQICSSNLNVSRIAPEQIKEANWKNEHFYRALRCLVPKNKEFLEVVATRMSPNVQIIAKNSKGNNYKHEIVEFVKMTIELFAKAKYKGPKAIEMIGAALAADPEKFAYSLQDYVEKSGTTSISLRRQIENAISQSRELLTVTVVLNKALLTVARKDKAFIDVKFEDALNEKVPHLKTENAELFEGLLKKSDIHRSKVVREVQESKDFNRVDSALLFMKTFDKPELQMLPHLAGLVNGANPLTTRMLSLLVIKEWASLMPSWKPFFLSVYSGKAPYQLKQLAIESISNATNYLSEAEISELLAKETDIRLQKKLTKKLYESNYEKYHGMPEVSTIDVNSQILTDLKAGKIPYTIIKDDAEEETVGSIKLVQAALGVAPDTMLNSQGHIFYRYGFDSSFLLINTKNNSVLAIVGDSSFSLNVESDEKAGMVYVEEYGKFYHKYLGVFGMNKNATTIEQDYSESFFKLHRDLEKSLRAEKKLYARIIDGGGVPEIRIRSLVKPGILSFEFDMSEDADQILNGVGKVQFIPGANGKGTIKILEKKVTGASLGH